MIPKDSLRNTLRQRLIGEGLRFVLVGLANTGFTYLIYLALLTWIRYELAYVLAYVVGIGTSYLMNAAFVFRQPLSWRGALTFPTVYIVQMVLGTLLLKALVEFAGIAESVAPLIVVAASLPVTFLMSRFVLTRSASGTPAPPDRH